MLLPSARLLLKSLISEEGYEDHLGELCGILPIFPSGKTLNQTSSGERRNPAEVHSATQDRADAKLLLRVGL